MNTPHLSQELDFYKSLSTDRYIPKCPRYRQFYIYLKHWDYVQIANWMSSCSDTENQLFNLLYIDTYRRNIYDKIKKAFRAKYPKELWSKYMLCNEVEFDAYEEQRMSTG
jgi:hypothetical protein